MTTPATTPADGELLPAPTTYMNEDDARHWAWQHAKKDLGTDKLSIGENASNMAFFIQGWAYRGQYESQRAPESFEQWFDQTSGFTEHDEAVARAAWQACAALATPSPGKADAEDAARYRWLRDHAQPHWRNGPGLYWYLPHFMTGTVGEKLDAVLDAALAAAEAPNGRDKQ